MQLRSIQSILVAQGISCVLTSRAEAEKARRWPAAKTARAAIMMAIAYDRKRILLMFEN
jgi:hypothetical protein